MGEEEFNGRAKLLESAVIGTLISHPDCYGKICGILSPSHFFTPRYGVYFAAIAALAGEGIEPDALLVSERMPQDGSPDFAELAKLAYHEGYRQNNIVAYAERVRDQRDYAPKSATHNDVLDNEDNYCTVDLLAHIANGHTLKELSKSVAKAAWLPESTVFLVGAAVFASMACRRYSVAYRNGKSIPIGLYVVTEQPSGAGKSRCMSVFQGPFFDAHKRAADERRRQTLDLAQQADMDSDAKARLAALKAQPLPALFLTNATPEGMERTLASTDGFFSAVSSEQGLFNSLLGMSYGDGKRSNNNDLLLNGYDGGYLNTVRIGRDGFNGHVGGGVCLFAQSGSIDAVIAASKDTGMSQRFLMLVEPSMQGMRDHAVYREISPELVRDYGALCDGLADAVLSGKGCDKLALTISRRAWGMVDALKNEFEPELAPGGKYSHAILSGAVSKADMQVMKLAAVLHLTDSACKGYGDIADRHVESAIGIMRDMVGALVKLCTDKGVIGMTAEFTAVINYLTKSHLPKTERDIVNSLRNTTPFKHMTGNKSAAVKETIKEMVKQGVLSQSYRVSGDEKQIPIYSLGQ